MKTIPLRAVPNQRFTFSNGQDRWVIEIKVAISSMICNLWLNDDPVVLGSRIVAGVPIIWSPRLATGGNFGILTEGGDEPWWESFGTTQRLVFWESDMAISASRFVDLRSRHISPSLAELTALVNTAMRIEDIGYYPPTWQALQEAISYALSVVRSHAPEQGQILLATQMLTRAIGDLIKWLSIDFAAGEWDESLVFSRASTATYWGQSRTLLEAAVDEARIQHDPVTGEALGLLIESSATNSRHPSWYSNFIGQFQTENNITVTEDAAQAPDGTQTAVLVEATDVSGIDELSFRWTDAGRGFARSVFIKPVGNIKIIQTRVSNSTPWLTYNVETGETSRSSDFILRFGREPVIEVSKSGWIRLDGMTRSLDDNGYWSMVRVRPLEGELSEGGGVLVWGTQDEEWDWEGQKPFTSYIPTTDSPVTRDADEVYRTLGEEFNPDEGTFFFEFKAYVGGGWHQYVNFNNAFRLYENTAVPNRVELNWGVGGARLVRSGVPSGYHSFKIALTYAGQQAQLVVRLDDDASVFSTETDFRIDNTLYLFNRSQGDRAADGIFKTVEYYPETVSEERLNQMVGGVS